MLSMIGTRLKILRQSKGATAATMAAIAGVRRQTWHGWEAEEYRPSIEHLQKIATVTGLSLDWLLLGRGQPGI